MKKLLILTAALMMIVGTVGCRCLDRCFMGAQNGGFGQMGPCGVCPPMDPCDPCASGPAVLPGPTPYAVPGA